MFYRFVICNPGTRPEAIIGFTIQAADETQAIARAQIVVNNLQVDTAKDSFAGDIGGRQIGGIDTQDISIYAGDGLRVTAGHIEDWWKEEHDHLYRKSLNATRTGKCQKETLLHDLRRASGYLQTQASKHYSRGNEATHANFSILFEAVNKAAELIAGKIDAADVRLETP